MTTRAWKVYGQDGHRQRASFGKSFSSVTWDGIPYEIENADKTGTNEYTIIRITADTAEACERELNAQLSDGVFENCRFGEIEEII